ncbi:MAG: hypothetical protein ACI8UP_000582 [Porticoccaceae bacterium]|jgi:hypothetical protein
MNNSLLAHIASNFISEYENVANSSVAYLLNEYSAAQDALKSVLGLTEVPTYYITELSSSSNGRPDITGLHNDGSKAVIIEGKFWANLTENQPANYLKELDDSGKLLFLAPEKRLISLILEVEKRLGGEDRNVVVCSWIKFLGLVEIENNKNHDNHLASDLIQIKELCQKMDSEGMPPLSLSDLDPMNGRITSQFADVIGDCNPILREWEHSDFKGLQTTSSKYGHGFYFRAYQFGCYLSFDSYRWFIRDIHSPVWLKVIEHEFKTTEQIKQALNDFDPINSYGEEYGIQLQTGMDKAQLVENIVNQTKMVLEHLNNKLSSG